MQAAIDGKPSWLLPFSPDIDIDFARGRFWGAQASQLTVTRATPGTALDQAGNLWTFGSGEARVTNRGLLIEGASTNILLNSLAPATQTVTVSNATVYTCSVVGSGSLALTGATTGAVTQAAPLTFTTGSTSLTVTVSGTLVGFQCETGTYASSIIPTTGTAAARNADVVTLSVAGIGSTLTLYGQGTPLSSSAWATSQGVVSVSDGTGSNRAVLYRFASTLVGSYIATPASFSTATTLAQYAPFKAAARVQTTSHAVSFNGTAPTTSGLTFTATGLNQIQFGTTGAAGGPFQGYVERVGLWKTLGLSDAQVQTLSSPAAP